MNLEDLNPVSWYPGHMLKAQRQIGERLKLIDVVVVVLDARAPHSSFNFDLHAQVEHKARVLLLNKSDLADEETTALWKRHWADEQVLIVQANRWGGRNTLLKALNQALDADHKRKGRKHRRLPPHRAMIIGMPNVGKSSLINSVLQKKLNRVGPRPGVTRHQQWAALGKDWELLDTPGVMAPRLADAETGLRLGLVAAIKDRVIGEDKLASYCIHALSAQNRLSALDGYELGELPETIPEVLKRLSERWGMKVGGGEPDLPRTCKKLLQDFRSGKFGRLSLEHPDDLLAEGE
jgi:ribosome biogenesis GTPase A